MTRENGDMQEPVATMPHELYMPQPEKKRYLKSVSSKRDALTGLLNHASFQIELQQSFTLARSKKTPVACLLVDIDYFHAINNRFGYAFGDAILLQVGQILNNKLRRNASIGRFGGEEFAIVWFPGSQKNAIDTAEELRRKIAETKFSDERNSTFITVSIGLAVSDDKTRSANELLSSSQLVLRTAKREGRNRVCYWERDMPARKADPEVSIISELQQKFSNLEREIKAYGAAEVRTLLDDLQIPDAYDNDHAENVAFIAASIADEFGLPEAEIDIIISAALLHDIGKAGIDYKILAKDGPLTPEEFEEIKKHPMLGAEFLNQARFFEKELPLILHHHEKYDGNGYPDGLKGEEIPIGARIIGLAETIDGLLSGSTYREALSIKETIAEIRRCSGTQFDPQLVQLAVQLLENGRIG